MSLQPVTLVTGASSGIGAALADVFARNGHDLALVARRSQQLDALADRIARNGQKRPLVIAADLSRSDAGETIEAELKRHGCEVQFLVNNAGVGAYGYAANIAPHVRQSMIDLNIRAPTALILQWMDPIVRQRGGILNVASTAAFLPRAGMAMYHATKAYMLSLSEALHSELAEDGVRVCALCPGPVLTEFFSSAGTSPAIFPNFLYRSAERVAREGYEGFMAGRAIVIPGFANKVFCQLPRVFPRGLLQGLLAPRDINRSNSGKDRQRS